MKTRHVLFAANSESGTPLATYLTAQGATPGPDPEDPYTWRIPAESRGAIKGGVQQHTDEFTLFYEFTPSPEDKPDGLAAYLGIAPLHRTQGVSPTPYLRKDPDDFRIVANAPMRELLEPLTDGVTWGDYEKSRGAPLFFLQDATPLPDAIEIPGPLSVEQLDAETWDASDDGRSIITQRNLDHLKHHGISYSTAHSVAGTIYPRPKFPVFGGGVIDVVRRSGVDLIIYLAPETLEIELW